MFFGQKYNALKEAATREEVKEHLRIVLKFISARKRNWSLIFFHPAVGNSNDAIELF